MVKGIAGKTWIVGCRIMGGEKVESTCIYDFESLAYELARVSY